MKQIFSNVYLLTGSVNCGVLVHDGHALLIDAPELPCGQTLPDILRTQGVHTVDKILLTQHRRAHCGGLFHWGASLPELCATQPEAEILANAGAHWKGNYGKYHRYECLPDQFLPFESLSVDTVVRDAEQIIWHEFTITPIVFGAQSAGDCAYLVQTPNGCIAFCGALAMANGQIAELFSLHTALSGMMSYHCHMGGLIGWRASMVRVLAAQPQLLIPAYGKIDTQPAQNLPLLLSRLERYAEAYDRTSAVRYYFPDEYRIGFELPLGIDRAPHRAKTTQHPEWLSRIGETTSYLLRAPSGHAILIDTGDADAIAAVQQMLADGRITSLDACWITHYHDDHLNALWMLTHSFTCPILSTSTVAEICRNPAAWFLPALADCNVKIRIIDDGAVWQWEGFTLTAMNLPGQSVYHAGLLAEKDGVRVLLCGDSFAPTGLDDYCAYNRNLPDAGRGYRHCLELVERCGMPLLVNEHQSEPFVYTAEDLAYWRRGLDDRDSALAELLPSDPGLGLDSQWLRCFPAEQTITSGAMLRLSLQLTSHGEHSVRAVPRLPWQTEMPLLVMQMHGHSTGSTELQTDTAAPDTWVHLDLPLPQDLKGDFVIPIDCWLDGYYIGTFAHAFICVI